MINWKLYLSDLEKWRIQITGTHVPFDVDWRIPYGEKERFDEDTRDLILEFAQKSTDDVEIKELIAQKQKFASPRAIPSCKRIKRFRKNRLYKEMAKNHSVHDTDESSGINECTSKRAVNKNTTPVVVEEVINNSEATENEQSQDYTALAVVNNPKHEDKNVETVQEEQLETAAEAEVDKDNQVVSYYDGTQISGNIFADHNSMTQLDPSLLHQAFTTQNIVQAFNLQKLNQHGLAVEVITSESSPQIGNVTVSSASSVPECGSEMELITCPLSQVAPVESVPSHIQSLPQVQTVLNTVIVGGDSGVQPCYGSYGDGTITYIVCSQDSPMQGQ